MSRRAPSGPIEVRAASAADAAVVASLLEELGYPATPDEVVRRLAQLQGPENALLLAAAGSTGAVHGLIGVHRLPVLHGPAPVCYITALVVAAAARGQGMGRALLEAAEAWARRAGCTRLVVTSAEHRTEAHAFYERAGFPCTGRRFVRQLASPTQLGAGGAESDRATP